MDDAINSNTLNTRRNNVFQSKQRTKKVLFNMFGSFEVRTKVRLMFAMSMDRVKGKC